MSLDEPAPIDSSGGRPAPAVSVVIPTLRRPDLLRRALHSVMTQTLQDFEIIVVVDGPDPATMEALRGVADPRLHVIQNAQSQGAGRARNIGARAARGAYIAFLDDDDAFLPKKLEKQLALAAGREDRLVTCLSRIVRPQGSEIWPRVIYDNTHPFDEYLFDRRKPFAGDAFIQTSSQLVPRALYLRSPFPEHSPHDDWEFVIRLVCGLRIRLETVPDVLVDHHIGALGHSLSNRDAWKRSLAWVAEMRDVMTARARTGFCLGVVGPRAASEGDWRAILPILQETLRHGQPRLMGLLFFAAVWVVPAGLRRRLRLLLSRNREGAASPLAA